MGDLNFLLLDWIGLFWNQCGSECETKCSSETLYLGCFLNNNTQLVQFKGLTICKNLEKYQLEIYLQKCYNFIYKVCYTHANFTFYLQENRETNLYHKVTREKKLWFTFFGTALTLFCFFSTWSVTIDVRRFEPITNPMNIMR